MDRRRYRCEDLAGRIRELVPARAAAERYGFEPNRAGYICCPFHNERTPSCKLFDDGGWKCFGCGAGGSSVDFVMRLFGLDFRQALVRMDMDFSLGLTGERTRPRPKPGPWSDALKERERVRRRKRELLAELDALGEEHYRLHQDMQLYAPDGPDIEELHPLFARALRRLPDVQYRLGELEIELGRLERGGKTGAA